MRDQRHEVLFRLVGSIHNTFSSALGDAGTKHNTAGYETHCKPSPPGPCSSEPALFELGRLKLVRLELGIALELLEQALPGQGLLEPPFALGV